MNDSKYKKFSVNTILYGNKIILDRIKPFKIIDRDGYNAGLIVCLDSLLSCIDICASRDDSLISKRDKYGNSGPERYSEFCDKNFKSRFITKSKITGNFLYKLRCGFLHAGSTGKTESTFTFNSITVSSDNVTNIEIEDLCYELLNELEIYTGLVERVER